jgi:hypothetical protein
MKSGKKRSDKKPGETLMPKLIGSIRYAAVDKAIKQGRVFRIGNCVSGVKSREPLLSRLALATEPAFLDFDRNIKMQAALRGELERTGSIDPQPLEDLCDLQYAIYNHNRTFGLHQPNSWKQELDYREALGLVFSPKPGSHRVIHLKVLGIENMPNNLEELPEHLFSTMIANIGKYAKDPTTELRKVRLNEQARMPLLINEPDGTQTLELSTTYLHDHPEWYEVKAVDLPIERGKLRLFASCREWFRRLFRR